MRSHLPLRFVAVSFITALAAGGCGNDAATPNTFNGCTDSMFIDRTAAAADRTVGFGGTQGSGALSYAPQCMLVAVGQTVTFAGTFAAHPLEPGTSPSTPTVGSPNNPIRNTATGMTATFTFSAAGTYPYNCQFHYNSGMVGVIRAR